MKKIIALLLALVMVLAMAACTQEKPEQTNPGTEPNKTPEQTTPATTEKKDPVTITVYPLNANLTSGPVEGWLGQWLLENYNVILEVWAFSDEKANALIAGSELPDIMYLNNKTDFKVLEESGLFLDLDPYLEKMPHVMENPKIQTALEYTRQYVTNGTLSFMPLRIGTNSTAADTERDAIKLNWAIYEEIGAPEMETWEDLVDVLKQMQAAHPTAPDGSPMYAMHLFNNMDTTYFYAMYSWLCINGYYYSEMPYFLASDAVDGNYEYILDEDGVYKEGLKFFNTLYREGLLDPDSITTDRTTQHKKIEAGGALAGWAAVPGWEQNGYWPVFVNELQTPTTHAKTGENVKKVSYGSGNYLGVNAKTEHLDEVLAILDMFADPDALTVIVNGPQGDMWDIDANGKAYMTEKGIGWWVNGQEAVLNNGEVYKLFNTQYILASAEPNSYGTTIAMSSSDQCIELKSQTPESESWREHYNANNYLEVLNNNNAAIYPFYSNQSKFAAAASDEQNLIIDEAKNLIVQASWKMVYAETDAEFEQIWANVVKDCEELGIKAIAEWRIGELAKAAEIIASLNK